MLTNPSLRVYRSIFDLYKDEPEEEDCFEMSLRRSTLAPFRGMFLICCECPRLCFIPDPLYEKR